LFQLESGSTVVGHVYSANIVGYVNLFLPPGLSLIANPLLAYDNSLGSLIPTAPDGAQVLTYLPGVGYEVSTFDALAGAWSNPDLKLPPGRGFFYNNASPDIVSHTFVGEVRTGTLINHLPAGFSTEGALVPQEGSISSVHGIPGQPGDILRLYVNDQQGGGDYLTSTYNANNGWMPDLTLGVAKGFVSEKQSAQDWIRVFQPY